MRFIQYLFPGGRRKEEVIDRSADIENMASQLWKAGYRFEIECFPDTQMVHMDCCDEDSAIAIEVCRNGPAVPARVDALVRAAYARWISDNQPDANTRMTP